MKKKVLFLQKRLGYTEIYEQVARALDGMEIVSKPDLEEILEADQKARIFVREHVN